MAKKNNVERTYKDKTFKEKFYEYLDENPDFLTLPSQECNQKLLEHFYPVISRSDEKKIIQEKMTIIKRYKYRYFNDMESDEYDEIMKTRKERMLKMRKDIENDELFFLKQTLKTINTCDNGGYLSDDISFEKDIEKIYFDKRTNETIKIKWKIKKVAKQVIDVIDDRKSISQYDVSVAEREMERIRKENESSKK